MQKRCDFYCFPNFIVSWLLRILLFRGYCEFYCFRVAQLIDLAEHSTSKPDVAGSIPSAVKQTLQLARCEHIQSAIINSQQSVSLIEDDRILGILN